MHYITPPSNLVVVNNNNDADLTWVASPDTVLGYNVYRLDPNATSYVKVNSSLVTGTTFTDNTVAVGGLNTYIVKIYFKYMYIYWWYSIRIFIVSIKYKVGCI